jgi:hypothetical protein
MEPLRPFGRLMLFGVLPLVAAKGLTELQSYRKCARGGGGYLFSTARTDLQNYRFTESVFEKGKNQKFPFSENGAEMRRPGRGGPGFLTSKRVWHK